MLLGVALRVFVGGGVGPGGDGVVVGGGVGPGGGGVVVGGGVGLFGGTYGGTYGVGGTFGVGAAHKADLKILAYDCFRLYQTAPPTWASTHKKVYSCTAGKVST